MSRTPKSFSKWVLSIGAAALLISMGCSSGPNEQQLRQLEETKAAAAAAEQKLSDCQSEKSSLESQLAAKQRELKAAQDEFEAVKRRLGE